MTPLTEAVLKYEQGTTNSKAHVGAFRRGFEAAQAGKPRESNPYNEKGYRGAWRDGWAAAKESA